MDLDYLAVENFREYLRIPSVHPDIDYTDCVNFLRKQANDIGLTFKVFECYPKNPTVVLTWTGTDDTLPSIMLNSHMDVVPVFPEKWTYPPFEAHMTENGDIYARGSQDTKDTGIQYLEAIRRLKLKGKKLKRTVHVTFVPDEETGGIHGMNYIVKSEHFENLNVGFALDEGGQYPEKGKFHVYYGDKSTWHIWVHCTGTPCHGTQMFDGTPGEKLQFMVNKFMNFRAKEKQRLEEPNVQWGDITTVNMTRIEGGVQRNVVPEVFKIGFDIRLHPLQDHSKFEEMINGWCREAGEGVFIEFDMKDDNTVVTDISDENRYWKVFESTCRKLNYELEVSIFPATTDARYLRQAGIPALNFSPTDDHPCLAHANNEYMNKDVFLRGIEIYEEIIYALGTF